MLDACSTQGIIYGASSGKCSACAMSFSLARESEQLERSQKKWNGF